MQKQPFLKQPKKRNRCNCDASCGENRYHRKGSEGCKWAQPYPLEAGRKMAEKQDAEKICDYCNKMRVEIYRLQGRNGEFQICKKCLDKEYKL